MSEYVEVTDRADDLYVSNQLVIVCLPSFNVANILLVSDTLLLFWQHSRNSENVGPVISGTNSFIQINSNTRISNAAAKSFSVAPFFTVREWFIQLKRSK